jgi:hypothetical protein
VAAKTVISTNAGYTRETCPEARGCYMPDKSKKADNKVQGSGGDQGGRSKGSSKKEEGRKSSGNKKSGT